jgi:hypothetical protein
LASMTPAEIAAYCDELFEEFRNRGWSTEFSVKFIEVALRQKLEQVRARKDSL